MQSSRSPLKKEGFFSTNSSQKLDEEQKSPENDSSQELKQQAAAPALNDLDFCLPQSTVDFKGPHKDTYARMASTLKKSRKSHDQFATISASDEFYIEPTPAVLTCARTFLSVFWQNQENLEKMTEAQKIKFKRSKKLSVPSCISFVTATINDKKRCFISISGMGSEKNSLVWKQVKSFVDQLGKKIVPSYRFILLDLASDDFHKLIAFKSPNQAKAKDPMRECAEKGFTSEIGKLLALYETVFLDGIVNCVFYPFQNDKNYGKADLKFVTLPKHKAEDRLEVKIEGKPGFFLPTIACCPNCRSNKQNTIAYWNSCKQNKIFVSPLKAVVNSPIESPAIIQENNGEQISVGLKK